MTDSQREAVAKFFHDISPTILKLISEKYKRSSIVKHKGEDKTNTNFVTEADIAAENAIVEEIKKRFPDDKIIAEENYSEVKIGDKGRFWIIDPICGTANFARELKNFCTNIALAEDGELVAACVIDHSQLEYIWSVGGNRLYVNDEEVRMTSRSEGVIVEVDLSALLGTPKEVREKYMKYVSRLVLETNYELITLATSMGFAFASIGRIEAYVSANNKVWDIAAANFLMMQAGGVVTALDGTPWTFDSPDVAAAKNTELHKELLSFIK